MTAFRFKDGFLAGVASAATQIEGGDQNHSWYDWYCRGKIKDGSSPLRATDHIHRWQEDFDLMQQLGIQTYRFGVEWSRIEPEKGQFDEQANQLYRDRLLRLRELNIRPLLTLHHFTNPLWFEQMGAFTHPDSTALFLRFVATVVRGLGDLVNEFITINAPNIYAVFGYLYGTWPPGEKSMPKALRVLSRLAVCHIKAYALIHQIQKGLGRKDTRVGFAHHARVFSPMNKKKLWHRINARLLSRLFQDLLTKAILTGHFSFPLSKPPDLAPGKYYDFLGINYCTRSSVRGSSDGVRPGATVNDLGWEIWPQGVVTCAAELYRKYPAPIYITENGTCDLDDRFRARYLSEHLAVIADSDLPIERYYHWCFCDNFEWLEGESARFGLVHVDFATQRRTVKRSGHYYAELIKAGGCDSELYNRYVADQQYPQQARLSSESSRKSSGRIC